MNDMDRANALEQIAQMRAQLDRLEKDFKADDFNLPPVDPYPIGTVLRFNKHFRSNGEDYTYTALKSSSQCWRTSDGTIRTWSDLRKFTAKSAGVPRVAVAAAWL